MLKGAITALVTPFKKGKIDYEALEKLIEFQINNGIDGILIGGTTGETPTINDKEYEELLKKSSEIIKGRVPTIAGTGTNDLEKTKKRNKIAEKYSYDALLIITPYYNKPTQKGMLDYFKKVAESTEKEIVIYNVPGRTGVNILPETVAELSKIKNITAYKDACGNIFQTSKTLELSEKSLSLLSGEDEITYPIMALGGKGVISVVSNIMPKEMHNLTELCLNNEWEKARELHYYLAEMCRVLFIETNPIPVKTALSLMNMINLEFRSPLCEMLEKNFEILKNTLIKYKLI